ncbi:MAG: hypothetical protein ACKO8G_02010 [Actinomycetota bacterium]
MTGAPLQFTHSGARFLLGYERDGFGIWERGADGPLERFPRTDDGWAAAWTRFHALEPEAIEVGLAGPGRTASPPVTRAADAGTGAAPAAEPTSGARIHPGWWTLPLLLGWLGGLLAWAGTKHLDRRTARRLLLVGILESVVIAAYLMATVPGLGS